MKKHKIRCRKCGRFMKNWGWILNTIMWFTPRRGWCVDCFFNEDARQYLVNNLVYNSETKRWTFTYKVGFSNDFTNRLHNIFIKLDKSKLNKNNFLC